MLALAFILVVCSGLLNAIWNLFAKRSLNKTVFLWSIHVIAAIIYMPYFVYEILTKEISVYGYGILALSMIFQGLYFLFLARAYTFGDLSQVYPIMRGTGALLVPIISVSFMNESLSLLGWFGLAVILLGIINLSGFDFFARSKKETSKKVSVWLALAIGLCITGYTISDKFALSFISPIALVQVSHIGYLCSLSWGALRSKQIAVEWKVNWKTIFLGAILAPGSYLLFLFAMGMAQVAHLAPIREISIVFGTILGIFILKEQQGVQRIIASVLILLGVILIKYVG